MNPHVFAGLVTAAGLSSRMGQFKPLLPLRGKTVIENTVDSLLGGGASCVVVVLGYRGDELAELLEKRYAERVICAYNPDFAQSDMLRSVQIGCAALPPCEAFFLLPGDMPLVRRDTLEKITDCRLSSGADLVFPTMDGRRKHPPLISAELIPEICTYSGEDGLRGLWRTCSAKIAEVPVSDPATLLDLDTPEDYQKALEWCE